MVQGLGFRDQGLGLRVQEFWFGVDRKAWLYSPPTFSKSWSCQKSLAVAPCKCQERIRLRPAENEGSTFLHREVLPSDIHRKAWLYPPPTFSKLWSCQKSLAGALQGLWFGA